MNPRQPPGAPETGCGERREIEPEIELRLEACPFSDPQSLTSIPSPYLPGWCQFRQSRFSRLKDERSARMSRLPSSRRVFCFPRGAHDPYDLVGRQSGQDDRPADPAANYEILSYETIVTWPQRSPIWWCAARLRSARRAATAWRWQRSKAPPATATASWAIWQPHKQCWMHLGPPAVNLSWATARVMTLAHHLTGPSASLKAGVDDIRSTILAEAQRIADEDVAINRRMGAFGAEIVPQAVAPQTANILTHCNAGSLATVDYGTTLGVVRAAIEAGKRCMCGSMRRDPGSRARGSPPGN